MQGANEIDNINEIIEAIHKYPWPTDIAPIIIALADKRREDYLEIQRLNEIINDKISSNETKVDDAIEDAVVTESDDDDDDELFKAKSPWDK